MAAAVEAPTYRVIGAYVNAKCPGVILPNAKGGGYTVMGFYQGALLPPGVHPDDIERLLNGGFIEALPAEVA